MSATTTPSAPTVGTYGVRSTRGFRARVVPRVLLYFFLALGAIVFMFPLFWLVTTSFKPEKDVFMFPPNFIPTEFQWFNYPKAVSEFPFVQSFTNTLIILIGVEVGRLFSSSLAAFAFSRLRFPGRDVLFVVVLSTMMLPYHVTLLPQYLIFRDLGWLNTFLPLTVPSFFAVSAFFVFMLRQFFLQIPSEYDDAAEIDGCSPLGTYWRILLPMSMPAMGAVAIFTFMHEWNDYFAPLIYLNTPEKFTLALSFQMWQTNAQIGNLRTLHPYNEIMAMATVLTLVPVVVFFLTQRFFIQGVVISGVKG